MRGVLVAVVDARLALRVDFAAGFELRGELRVLRRRSRSAGGPRPSGRCVVVQCSIPPNSRTVHGSSTSSEKSWLLAAVFACCSLPMLPLVGERQQRGG